MPARLCPRLSDISVYSGVCWHRKFAIFVLRSLLNHSHYIQVFFSWKLPGRHLKLYSSSGQGSLACEWRRRSGARCLFAKWGMEVKKKLERSQTRRSKTCFHLLRAIQIVKLCSRNRIYFALCLFCDEPSQMTSKWGPQKKVARGASLMMVTSSMRTSSDW